MKGEESRESPKTGIPADIRSLLPQSLKNPSIPAPPILMDSILPDETSETHSPKSPSASPMDSIRTSETQSLSFSTREHKTPLIKAGQQGPIDSTLISGSRTKEDPQPEKKDNILPQGEAMTALHAALIRRDQGCLKLVLEHKPQLIRVTDSKGRNPLHYAASIGNYKVLNKLLKNPQAAQAAYQPDIFGHYPIHEAASAGHIEVIELLLKLCPSSWALPGKGGQSILHVGVQSGKENVVRYILKTQVFEKLINDLDANGDTPLHLATKGSHFKVIRVLTSDNRVNMSICNNDNLTALDIAEKNIVKGGSLRRFLTLTTLRIAKAPRARNLDLLGDEDQRDYITRPSKPEDFKERVNTLLLVSTLVATVTFAGGFTIPGGLTSDGMATMLTNSKFKAFVICDATALFCSILAVVSLIWAQLGEVSVIRFVIRFTVMLLGISLSMMVIAFSVGLYIVTSQLHWLAGAVCISVSLSQVLVDSTLMILFLQIDSDRASFSSQRRSSPGCKPPSLMGM